jgi:hypothetical protein
MSFEKSASILFLCFSILVAFSNVFIGQYQYLLFIVPFAVSIFMKGRTETFMESFGLIICATYIIYCQEISIGILLMSISTIVTFGAHKNHRSVRVQIFISAVIIFIATYFNIATQENLIVRSLKNAGIYVICVMAIHNKFYWFVKSIKRKEKPLEQKYLELLDELTSVAHDSIDALKNMQDGKNE